MRVLFLVPAHKWGGVKSRHKTTSNASPDAGIKNNTRTQVEQRAAKGKQKGRERVVKRRRNHPSATPSKQSAIQAKRHPSKAPSKQSAARAKHHQAKHHHAALPRHPSTTLSLPFRHPSASLPPPFLYPCTTLPPPKKESEPPHSRELGKCPDRSPKPLDYSMSIAPV